MKTISLHDKLISKFPNGLVYRDALELCIALFCSADWFDDIREDELDKKNIANVFSRLVKAGLVLEIEESIAIERGVVGDFSSSSHWLQIMNSSLSQDRFYDVKVIERLLKRPRG